MEQRTLRFAYHPLSDAKAAAPIKVLPPVLFPRATNQMYAPPVILFVSEGIPFFYYTNHGLSGIQLNFISIVIIEFGRIIVS